jgi:hypothetical protein
MERSGRRDPVAVFARVHFRTRRFSSILRVEEIVTRANQAVILEKNSS